MCVRVHVCCACVLAACFLIVADVGVTIARVRIRKSTNAAWEKANSMHVRLGARVRVCVCACVCSCAQVVRTCLPACNLACVPALERNIANCRGLLFIM